jgi:hypothetical protein
MDRMFRYTTATTPRGLCRLYRDTVEMYRIAEDGSATPVRPHVDDDIEVAMTENALIACWLPESPWATDAQISRIYAQIEAVHRVNTGRTTTCVVV